MTSPIDPIRRAADARRRDASKVEPACEARRPEDRNLPVPLDDPPESPPAAKADRPPAAAVFAAHLLGQDGQKRGLRGGPATLDAAKSTYTRTEWSGTADRRSRSGRGTKTEI